MPSPTVFQDMGKRGTRLPGFCLNRIRPHARVRSPPIQAKNDTSATKTDQKTENSCSACEEKSDEGVKPGIVIGRKIMIVVDSSLEAKGAVQWALTHTVQNQDTIILLHVIKPSKQGANLIIQFFPPSTLIYLVILKMIKYADSYKMAATEEASSKEIAPRAYELASSFKNMCNVKRPEVSLVPLGL